MKHIKEVVRDIQEFGVLYGIKSVFSRALHNNTMLEKAIYTVLEKESRQYLFQEDEFNELEMAQNKVPIVWTFWWQGIESLPEILKICYESHRRNIPESEVDYRILTKDNVDQYINIPDFIKRRLDNGEMSFTHFSDYLRVCLLEQYGGAWIDITLLMTKHIDISMFDYAFYSFNLGAPVSSSDGVGKIATQTKWAGFMMVTSRPRTELFVYLRQALTEYWMKHDHAINFFFMNILIRIAYDKKPIVRTQIDAIPLNNRELYGLQPVINEQFDSLQWDKLNMRTGFFKLTQKREVIETNDAGENTFYGHITTLSMFREGDE